MALAAEFVAVSASGEEAPPLSALPPPPPVVFEFGPRLGGAARLGDSGGLPITGRGGALLGAALAISPSPRFGIGLAYEHSGLGSERGDGDAATIDVRRSLDAGWATIRLDLASLDGLRLTAAIGPGVLWQHATAYGVVWGDAGSRPRPFQCSASGSMDFGLRASIGVEAPITERVAFTTDVGIDSIRLSSDLLGNCIAGSGTATLIGVRAGFSYRFDVTRFIR